MTEEWRRTTVYVEVRLLTTCRGGATYVHGTYIDYNESNIMITSGLQYTEQNLTPQDSPLTSIKGHIQQEKHPYTVIVCIHDSITLREDIRS